MPVRTHMKLVFRGEFMNSPEEWSFSTKFSRENPIGADATVDDIDDGAVDSALSAFIADTNFHNHVRVTNWRAYVIGTDGHMEGLPRIRNYATGTGPQGTGTSVKYPPDTALCVTTEGVERGHARFGRFYLPGPQLTLGTDWRMSQATAQDVVSKTTEFLKDVSDAIDLEDLQSSEMLNISNDAASTSQVVNNIRVGRVLDRISRRRRQLVEAYEASGVIDW